MASQYFYVGCRLVYLVVEMVKVRDKIRVHKNEKSLEVVAVFDTGLAGATRAIE